MSALIESSSMCKHHQKIFTGKIETSLFSDLICELLQNLLNVIIERISQ
jgi:hypothetical protein